MECPVEDIIYFEINCTNFDLKLAKRGNKNFIRPAEPSGSSVTGCKDPGRYIFDKHIFLFSNVHPFSIDQPPILFKPVLKKIVSRIIEFYVSPILKFPYTNSYPLL